MMREMLSRLRFFFTPRADDFDEELRVHLEHSIESKIAGGMPAAEARRQAAIEFGSVEAAREGTHAQHPRAWLEVLQQDLRFAMRSLKRDRGFALTAVAILAIGMGANIAVFSLVHTLLLRPLPFQSPDRLVWLQPAKTAGGLSGATYSADAYDDVLAKSRSYSDVTGYFAFSAPNNVRLTGEGTPQPYTGIPVIPNFLDVLGTGMELGRSFRAEDGAKGAAPVLVLSHAFWKTHFHGDRGIVNRAISVDGKPATVIGILPAAFDFGGTFSPGTHVDLLTPLSLDESREWGNIVTLIGRLRPGVAVQQAASETQTLFPQLYWSKRYADSRGSYGPGTAIALKEHVAGSLRRSLYILWGAVLLIQLIVCVNLSNLLLGRAASRSKEFSLRFALGATRGRLMRQLLTESGILCGAGTVLGISLATTILTWLAHQASFALPLLSELRIDVPTLLWTVLLAIGATFSFGVVPGLRITADANLQASLKDAGANMTEGRRPDSLRNVLIVSEIALACVLLVSAGLLLRSFLRVLEIDLGFQPTHAASISVEPPDIPANQLGSYYRSLLHDVASLPGVQSVGIADNLPLGRNRAWGPPGIKGVRYGRNERAATFVYMVTPGYLPTMGMHLQGRDFSWNDTAQTEPALILNEKAAHFLFPAGDAIDHMVVMGDKEVRIVGIVPDVHETDVEATSAWQVYLPISQGWDTNGAELVMRSTLDAGTLEAAVMQVLRRVNPAQPAMSLRPLQTFVDHSTSPRRFFAMLVAAFAATGLLLACLGLYGVISYSVTKQTQEIGIRMALGATRGSVLRSVLRRTLRLALFGIAAGTAGSLAAGRFVSAVLYGTSSNDPATFTYTVGLLLGVALLAGYLPARRAADTDPLTALRSQ